MISAGTVLHPRCLCCKLECLLSQEVYLVVIDTDICSLTARNVNSAQKRSVQTVMTEGGQQGTVSEARPPQTIGTGDAMGGVLTNAGPFPYTLCCRTVSRVKRLSLLPEVLCVEGNAIIFEVVVEWPQRRWGISCKGWAVSPLSSA